MSPKIKAEYVSLARLLKEVGHPSRLLMISELAKEERCVCDLSWPEKCDYVDRACNLASGD